jgi:hypothetical protein
MKKYALVQLDEDTVEIVNNFNQQTVSEVLLCRTNSESGKLSKVTTDIHEYIVRNSDNMVLHIASIIECAGLFADKTKYFYLIKPGINTFKVTLFDMSFDKTHYTRLYNLDFINEPAYAEILELNLYDHKTALQLAKEYEVEDMLEHFPINFHRGSYSKNFFSDDPDLQVSILIKNCF